MNKELSAAHSFVEGDSSTISVGSTLEGKLVFDQISRIYGHLKGEIHGTQGSMLIVCESGFIEGKVTGDSIYVDGCIRGSVSAKTRITISHLGRILGDVNCPRLVIETGGFLSGECKMDAVGITSNLANPPPAL